MGRLFNQYTPLLPTISPPPSAERVAWRALAMHALAERGYQELAFYDSGQRRMNAPPPLPEWVLQLSPQLIDVLTPRELQPLETAMGYLTRQQTAEATWLVEGLAVLWWALGVREKPTWDLLMPSKVLYLNVEPMSFPKQAVLRPESEIRAYGENVSTWQWRFIEFLFKGVTAMDIVAVCSKHGFDCEQLPLVQDDLAIGGHSFADSLDIIRGDDYPRMADERLRAAWWLCGLNPVYADIQM